MTYYGAQIMVSADLLADADAWPGTWTAESRPTRRERLRWWVSRNVTALRLRLGSWIAGVDLRDDWP